MNSPNATSEAPPSTNIESVRDNLTRGELKIWSTIDSFLDDFVQALIFKYF